MVPPKSGPINTILEGADMAHQGAVCQHSHLSSIIDDLIASTSQLQVLECIKQKLAVCNDTLAAQGNIQPVNNKI